MTDTVVEGVVMAETDVDGAGPGLETVGGGAQAGNVSIFIQGNVCFLKSVREK